MYIKPKSIKEMAAPQAKVEVKNLLGLLKDSIELAKYVNFEHEFPATVVIKNASAPDVIFNFMMSLSLSSKDKNYRLSPVVDSAFVETWKQVKRTYPEADIRIRGANCFIGTNDFYLLESIIKDFCFAWKKVEFSLLKNFKK